MIWIISQATAQADTFNLVSNVYLQWGALGVLALVVAYDRYAITKENKELKKENKQLLLDRMQDVKDYAKIDAQPNEELKKFIGVMYSAYIQSINKSNDATRIGGQF